MWRLARGEFMDGRIFMVVAEAIDSLRRESKHP
jgi:hypothetical protein